MKIKTTPSRFILILSVLTFSFFWTSCVDEESLIGSNIIPDQDKLYGFYDTSSSLTGYTVYDDSIRSDEDIFSSSKSYNLLGSYADPVFGISSADFLTQIRLSKNNVNFGDGFIPDSLVLYMKIATEYGEFRQFRPQQIYVYTLNDSIEKDSSYYSNINPDNYYSSSDLVGEFTYYPESPDSMINIHLDLDAFVDIVSDTLIMTDSETLQDHIKGLYITSDAADQGGQILSLDMVAAESQLSLFYHYAEDDEIILPASSTKRFNFLINENCARINHFEHNYNADWYSLFESNDSTLSSSIGYIQGMAGVKLKLDASDLKSWKDSTNYVIVKAEMIVPVLENSTTFFNPLSLMALATVDDEGTNSFLPDQYHNGTFYTDYFDGNYYLGNEEYRFNIAQYLQNIITGSEEYSNLLLYPYSTESPVIANRSVIDIENIRINIQYIRQ